MRDIGWEMIFCPVPLLAQTPGLTAALGRAITTASTL